MPAETVPGLMDAPYEADFPGESGDCRQIQVLDARDVIGGSTVLRQKLLVPLAAHLLPMLAQAVNRRIEDQDPPAWPQAAPRLSERLAVIGGVVQRCVVERRIVPRIGEGKPIEIGIDARESPLEPREEMRGRAEPVARICQDIDRHGTMAAQRQTIGHPSGAGAQIEQVERPPGLAFHPRQDMPLEIAVSTPAYGPLRGETAAQIAVRQRQIVRRVVGAAPLRLADTRIILKEALPFRSKHQASTSSTASTSWNVSRNPRRAASASVTDPENSLFRSWSAY